MYKLIKMKNQFQNYSYTINGILTKTDIKESINKFFVEHMITFPKKARINVLFKIKTTDGIWRSLGPHQVITQDQIDEYYNIICGHWDAKSDNYHEWLIDCISIRYNLSDFEKPRLFAANTQDNKTPVSIHPPRTIPNNTDILSWGEEIEIFSENSFKIKLGLYNNVTVHKDGNLNYGSVWLGSREMFYFQDTLGSNPQTFKRVINDRTTFYYQNGNCVYSEEIKKCSFITRKKADYTIKENFITMDLETRQMSNGSLEVISISIYDGKNVNSFYLSNYNNSSELMNASLLSLLKRSYSGYRIYLHNFSNFDGIFLLKVMAGMNQCTVGRCIKRDSNIIEIQLKYKINTRDYSIYFRDSCLLLPSSLKKLGDAFNVDTKKSIFPYKFVSESRNLDYIGQVPSIQYFENITLDEYNKYKNELGKKEWNLKEEIIKYCEIDVISLRQIIRTFQIKIYSEFEVDINNYPTLSSLAFGIYRVKYLKDDNIIPKLHNEIYYDIKQSYTGGSVDVYKPLGTNLYRYDVNSLYPHSMSSFPSPVGKPIKFTGDPSKFRDDPFGFFYVNVKTPENLFIPILQTRVKTTDGTKTMAPLGTWKGWYFSEEIKLAMNNGYEIEILNGYLFEKGYIFKDYVLDLYNIKNKSSKDDPWYIISKLLLNSLYGRFGMDPVLTKHALLTDPVEIIKMYKDEGIIIKDSIEIDENIELISYDKIENNEITPLTNVNVAIASSITAYSRITMSNLKIKYSQNIYYTDTDSIDLDIKLPDNYVSNKLGDFKLEMFFKKVVYLSPKVYSAILPDKKALTKIKGYKINEESKKDTKFYSEILNILVKRESKEYHHKKWYKDISAGSIKILDDKYTLMVNENKRKLIYKNKRIYTQPYRIKDNRIEDNKIDND